MATPAERGTTWKRCLQALFVFPETRDVAKSVSRCNSFSHESSRRGSSVMPRLSSFIPALHHALVKARANPPPNLSAGVELQTREYLVGLKDSNVRQYPITEYDSKHDEEGKQFVPPKHHQVNMDSYLHSYLSNPALYLLSVARAKLVVEAYGLPEPPEVTKPRHSSDGQRAGVAREAAGDNRGVQPSDRKIQQLLDLVLTCKRNAENEVMREKREGAKAPEKKRKFEQETAARALKYFKASQQPGRHDKTSVEGSKAPVSLSSVMGSLGLKDVNLLEDGSEQAAKLIQQLTGLVQAANPSHCGAQEKGSGESSPFGRLASKMGLPTNCDIDLRRQEELEDQTTGSVSSLEGFSPGSHSGETNHHGPAGRGGGGGALWRKAGANEEEEEEWDIPWVLIPITGLTSERYAQGDTNVPQDPRFQHLGKTTGVATATNSSKSPALSPEPSSPSSPFQCPSPEASPLPSPTQCPSPDPSPPNSPSQCPSPEPSPPPSSSQCPSPEPSPPPSPSQCPSPEPSPAVSPAGPPSPQTGLPPPSSQSLELNELNRLSHSGANEQRLRSAAFREFPGEEVKEPSSCGSTYVQKYGLPPGWRIQPSPSLAETGGDTGKVEDVKPGSSEQDKEMWPIERVQNRWEEEEETGLEGAETGSGDTTAPGGGFVFSPVVSSTVSSPLKDIDSIVDKHMGDFSSELQLLLQEKSVHYSLPLPPPSSTLNAEAGMSQHTLPYTPVSPFSQYVSFYNPCPPVQDYVTSLHNSVNCMLTEYEDRWPSQSHASHTSTDAMLENTVSNFVASVRAANSLVERDDDVSTLFSEGTAADEGSSAGRGSELSRGDEACWPDTTRWRRSPTLQVTLSEPTAACAYNPANPLEISRTVTQNVRQAQDGDSVRTVVCSADAEVDGGLVGPNCTVTVPGCSAVPADVSDSVSEACPSARDLNSVINRLEPDVLNNLVEIMKDIKKKSLQFYIHPTEPGDPVYEDVKEHLLKLGNVQQSPVDFLNQENSDSGLLVIIKNKDIAGHIHKIPGLMSLKRHSSVVFVGIDSLDDMKNNSCIELFVSGGCIVSDELVLNPDIIGHDRLAALLMFLEQHSSPESVWRWKIHFKTHKKLKEQARFRRDAASMLDVLSTYQKRQLIEFLPYHHCDTNPQSPDLSCLVEHQARYTQYRHTVFLTEHHFDKFPVYSNDGIIVASFEDILRNFSRLVGCHSIKDKQLMVEDVLVPKGPSRQLGPVDPVSAVEFPLPTFPEPVSSSNPTQNPPPQPNSNFDPLESVLHVPVSFYKDRVTMNKHMEMLQEALRHLRAEHQQKLQQKHQQESRPGSGISPLTRAADNGHATPPVGRGAPETAHSAPQPERCDGGSPDSGETRDLRGSTPVRAAGGTGDPRLLVSREKVDAVTGPSNRTEPADDQEKPDREPEEEVERGAFTACSVKDNGSRNAESCRGLSVTAEGAPSSTGSAGDPRAAGTGTPPVTDSNRAQQLRPQHTRKQKSFSQLPYFSQQPQRGAGLLQNPHLAQLHGQAYHPAPVLGPLTHLGGVRSILGPSRLWPGALGSTGAPLVWGFQQAGVDLLGGYYSPAGPGGAMHRGGRRGGGFNGM